MLNYSETPVQEIFSGSLDKAGVRLLVKREDLNHPLVSGNKWWKLNYNLEAAHRTGNKTILTFGGAYSNHIFATAAAAREHGFESIGIIRGEEMPVLNATLSFAAKQGMMLKYISRATYREKSDHSFIDDLKKEFGQFYLIPEGGTNALAIKGCEEFAATLLKIDFDCLCLPVGTGGTMAGLIAGFARQRKIIGFSALRNGVFLQHDVEELLRDHSVNKFSNWRIETAYDFGGYAKTTPQLDNFIQNFDMMHKVPFEHVYTGKMMFGIIDLIKSNFFNRGTTLLAIHTGGLQKDPGCRTF